MEDRFCPGPENCPECRCEICDVKKPNLEPTDAYRQSVKNGYYTSTIVSYKDKDGKIKYRYTRPWD